MDEITQKIERYTDELKHNECRLGEMTHNLNVVNTRLKQVDERLRQLHPGMRLDSLEDRCTCTCKHGYQPSAHTPQGYCSRSVYLSVSLSVTILTATYLVYESKVRSVIRFLMAFQRHDLCGFL